MDRTGAPDPLSVAEEARPLPAALCVMLHLRSPPPWTQPPACAACWPPCTPRAVRPSPVPWSTATPRERACMLAVAPVPPAASHLQPSLRTHLLCAGPASRAGAAVRRVHLAVSVSIPGSYHIVVGLPPPEDRVVPLRAHPHSVCRFTGWTLGHFHMLAIATLLWALVH